MKLSDKETKAYLANLLKDSDMIKLSPAQQTQLASVVRDILTRETPRGWTPALAGRKPERK